MPSRLKRYQQTRQLHYVTFTCHHRQPHLESDSARDVFEHTLERVRRWYDFYIVGYVVMPEHVHLLVSEPERSSLAVALQMLKQVSSRKLHDRTGDKAFWQKRYYDFNIWNERKRVEKLRYMHRNPVKRGLVENPEDWKCRVPQAFSPSLSTREGGTFLRRSWPLLFQLRSKGGIR
jgi:putative transposase